MKRAPSPPDRGAKVIALAVKIMAQGARGWSDGLAKAEKRVK